MGTGFTGTFVIPWSQTVTDGISGASAAQLIVGATWQWAGQAHQVDGPGGIARLAGAQGMAELHQRAARKARQMCGRIIPLPLATDLEIEDDRLFDTGFVLTDGTRAFVGTVIDTGQGQLAAFSGELPPSGQDLWVARLMTSPRAQALARRPVDGGVICFAAGTQISTPYGRRFVETLRPGDLVQTRDDGPQPILWRGARRLSGARLHMTPHLRPVRIHAGALDGGRPDADLLVSPRHRVLITGRPAQALFGAPEVLVQARGLLARAGVVVDLTLTEVTYVHLMLDRHQILTANGVACESFHPDEADLGALAPEDLETLSNAVPGALDDPALYGAAARRRLTAGEAAILTSDIVTT